MNRDGNGEPFGHTAHDSAEIDSFAGFFPYYLRAHSRPGTRAFHYAGTLAASACVIVALLGGGAGWLLAALAIGYGLAWIGHALIEHNRPATFGHPFYSLAGDFVMTALWLGGRLGGYLRRAGVESD